MQRLRLALILPAAVIISLLLGGGIALYSFVHSGAANKWLTQRLNRSLRADGKLEPMTWKGLRFYSPAYSATGRPKSSVISFDANEISAHLNWPMLFSRVWDLDQVSIQKVNVYLGKRSSSSGASTAQGEKKSTNPSPGIKLPHLSVFDFRINRIAINESNLHWSAGPGASGELLGTKIVAIRRGKDSWNVSASGGKAQHAGLPPVTIDSLSASTESKGIAITQAKLFGLGAGAISLNGFVGLDDNQTSRIHAEFGGLSIDDLYPETLHLSGIASGSADYTSSIQREDVGTITGSLHVDKLRTNWSLFLGKVGSFVKTSGMDDWALDSVDTQVVCRGRHTEFSHLVAKYQNQLRVEGNGTIDSGQINARLSLGLSPAILKWLPGVQQKVFIEERDGLYWAPVQMTGTPENPKEDLSKRVASALQESIGQGLKDQAKDAVKSLLDLLRH